MDLDRYLIYNSGDYDCTICERCFKSLDNLYAHCRQTSRHSWCERCRRVFVSVDDKDKHLQDSNRHNIFSACSQPRDFENAEELQDHSVEIHHFCPDCDIYHGSARELRGHDLTQHYICLICDDRFQNANNLRMHQQKHQIRIMECYGCTQTFKSFSGMLIHLVFGNCQSGATEATINQLARKCYQSRKYTIGYDEGWGYRCPSCDKEFPKLSALYQHVEDVLLCGSSSKQGCLAKLEHFIARNLQQRM
ncbi:hypothetical protein BDW69DRAFT_204329 [Aspergillus filifer]